MTMYALGGVRSPADTIKVHCDLRQRTLHYGCDRIIVGSATKLLV
ncbi:hypothetical protein [Nostoc sp.]